MTETQPRPREPGFGGETLQGPGTAETQEGAALDRCPGELA